MTHAQRQAWLSVPETTRKELYVSCWYASEHESAAMWKLYLSDLTGVAIKSSTDRLIDIAERSAYTIGMTHVEYVNYETESIPITNTLFPVKHKRLSFAHEQEFRAVIWSSMTDNEPLIAKDVPCVSVPIIPAHLIEAVHVSPLAPRWVGELVQKIITRYGLNAPVIRSILYDRPIS